MSTKGLNDIVNAIDYMGYIEIGYNIEDKKRFPACYYNNIKETKNNSSMLLFF